jgi:esterase/lipase superfamily enzyme
MSKKLGDLLVRGNLISTDQLHQAVKVQQESGGSLRSTFIQLGYVSDDDVTKLLSVHYGVPAIDFGTYEVDAEIASLIPEQIARKFQILPVRRSGKKLVIAMADPTDIVAMDEVKFLTGLEIEPVVASENAIIEWIESGYGTAAEAMVQGVAAYELESVDNSTLDQEPPVEIVTEPVLGREIGAVLTVNPVNAEYVVWYGTTRRPKNPSDPSQGYSAERDGKMHYGACSVFIPKSHKIGSVGSPWWKRLITLTDDRLKLMKVRETDGSAHWQEIADRMMAVAPEDQHGLVFVHGYNVSFEDAAVRAAQIGFDLSIKGAMAFFSWPSQGNLDGYLADEATIEVNEDALGEYLTTFAARSGARMVHIIAHSMGNRGVLRAVARIAADAERKSGVRFGQFFLAAADVDVDKFKQLAHAYREVAARATLYVSKRDLAVEASRWLHQFPRVGLMPPVTVIDGLDTINVTNSDLTFLGHGYVADSRDVLVDMHTLIHHNAPPDQRFGLRPTTSELGERYWLIGA